MRVLLVQPEAPNEVAFSVRDRVAMAEPLALEYVAAAAKVDGHEVHLLDLRLNPDSLDRTLQELQPGMVGVTGFSMHVPRGLDICKRAKELVPGVKTAAGGVHAMFEPQDFFERQMDYVFTFSAVKAFREVLRRLESGEHAEGVPGSYAQIDGQFLYGGEPSFEEALPSPDRTITPMSERTNYVIEQMRPIALMRTSVGCPFRCTFCSVWRMTGGKYFTDEIVQVVEELKKIPEDFVHFTDDEPFVKTKRMAELADCIEAEGVKKSYFLYCRIDSFLNNLDLIERWANIGLKCLFIGAETAFKDELDRYNKGGTCSKRLDEVKFINDKSKELGIRPYFGFIVHPSYTKKEFDATKNFVRERGLEFPSFTVWTPLPGTSDGGTDYSEVIDRRPNGRPDWSKFDFFHPVTPTALPKEEFMEQFDSLFRELIVGASTGSVEERARIAAQRKADYFMQIARLAMSARKPG